MALFWIIDFLNYFQAVLILQRCSPMQGDFNTNLFVFLRKQAFRLSYSIGFSTIEVPLSNVRTQKTGG
jgi:hypothetical protein